ncbi:MAG: ABC transporter permease [Nitrolancea sp.]
MTTSIAKHAQYDQSSENLLISQQRPERASALMASLLFGWRGLLKIKHVPEQMLDVVAIPIVFTLMFTYLFGGALAGSTQEYLQYIVPGTLVMAVVLVTMYSGIGLNADISKGVFDRYRTLPIWGPSPIIGALIGDLGRYTISSVLVLGLGFAIGFRPGGGALEIAASVALVILFAVSLSWVWTVLGLVMRSSSAVMTVGTVVLFPLSLASNVFVDPNTMPGWLQWFVKVNPISHLVTAIRELMLNGSTSGSELAWVLLGSLALTIVFAPVTMYLYGRQSA